MKLKQEERRNEKVMEAGVDLEKATRDEECKTGGEGQGYHDGLGGAGLFPHLQAQETYSRFYPCTAHYSLYSCTVH